jgi:hypothetical protein
MPSFAEIGQSLGNALGQGVACNPTDLAGAGQQRTVIREISKDVYHRRISSQTLWELLLPGQDAEQYERQFNAATATTTVEC